MSSSKKQTQSSTNSIDLLQGKIPPHSKDTERSLIGMLMRFPDAIDIAIGILVPEAFYVEAHQRIFRVMTGLYNKSQPIDLITVTQKLADLGELDIVGGPYYLTECNTFNIPTTSTTNHCLVIQEKFILREIGRAGAEMYNSSFDTSEDVFDKLDAAQQSIMKIGEDMQQEAQGADTVLVKTMTQIAEWGKLGTSLTGVPTGFPTLDKVTRGWQPGDLIILAARPSVGKSALALKFARTAVKNETRNYPVAIWSLEMSSTQLMLRMLSAESEIKLYGIQSGNLDAAQEKRLHMNGAAPISQMKLFFDDAPDLTLHSLRSKARRLKKKHGIGLIIIDYLQLMHGVGKNREQEISSISRGLKNLGKELNVPIIALSQMSREFEKRSGTKRVPQLSDLRESGAIEQDADLVMFLWGPEDDAIKDDATLINRRYLRIAKARTGMLKSFDLDFRGEIQLFSEMVPAPGFKPVSTLFDI